MYWAPGFRPRQRDITPIIFYERHGFERTGEIRFDEVMRRLKLR
jgi:sigma54-dependent transcription regulator